MKGGAAFAAIAAMAGSANAINHRHAHDLVKARSDNEACGCSTVYYTVTGEATWVPNPAPATPVAPTSTLQSPVPTPQVVTCPTPGTYTIPATTVTLSETTTVCGASSTRVAPGTHTVGGVTTVVETATTVTCPVATVTTSDGVVTSTIVSTTYVCPSAGTYTIAPVTSTVTEETDIEFPVPTVYAPGTYTQDELVLTITETDFVTVCPYSAATPAPAPVATAASIPKGPTVDVGVEVDVDVDVNIPPIAPKGKGPKQPSGTFDGTLGSNGDHYGITYTPYDGATGNCKTAEQVDADILEIKNDGFNVVRVYSTDCNTLPSVGAACEKHGVKMMIGVFVKTKGRCSYEAEEIREQVDAIAEWARWDLVDLFIVGNEAIMNKYCLPSQLRGLIDTVKSKCSGYTGPYTIAETLNVWENPEVAGAICDAVDFTGANIHPYFNAAVAPDMAGDFVNGQLDILDSICPGKKAFNLECGWPTGGQCNGAACPGVEAQTAAIMSIREKCGGRTIFFSFENDEWKEPGACNCERSWGSKAVFSLAI